MNNITAAILAGGKSRRMGTDKSLISVEGEPLISRIARQLQSLFADVVISAPDDGRYDFLSLPVIPDGKDDCGPLMGIATLLSGIDTDLLFVVPCDMPDINLALAAELYGAIGDYDCIALRCADGKPEPLFAIYHRKILPHIHQQLETGRRSINALLHRVDTHFYDVDSYAPIVNLNTRQDLMRWSEGTARQGEAYANQEESVYCGLK